MTLKIARFCGAHGLIILSMESNCNVRLDFRVNACILGTRLMTNRDRKDWLMFGIAFLCAITIQGCGGGGGSASQSGGSPKTSPTAVTKTNTASHLAALGQGALSISFAGYGPNVHLHNNAAIQLPMIGVWDKLTVAPDGINQALTLDQAGTQPAGKIQYITEDIGEVLAGTIAITAGPYSGLTGSYLQSKVTGGYSGNEAYSIPNIATASAEFSLTLESSGSLAGTEELAVTLGSGYVQNEHIVLNADSSAIFTTTDANKYQSILNFTAAGSGTGTIKGTDPGLPAQVIWDVTGTGKVTFADGSVEIMTRWSVATS